MGKGAAGRVQRRAKQVEEIADRLDILSFEASAPTGRAIRLYATELHHIAEAMKQDGVEEALAGQRWFQEQERKEAIRKAQESRTYKGPRVESAL
jgi:hypothetical protein